VTGVTPENDSLRDGPADPAGVRLKDLFEPFFDPGRDLLADRTFAETLDQ
jgi:hypothetical protein